MKRAVWLPNWIGDAVMATPALNWLRETSPAAEVVAICRRPVDQVLAGHPAIDRFLVDQSGKPASIRERLAFVQALRKEGFDEIIQFTNSLRTAAVARLAGIPVRIGFARDGRGWLLNRTLKPHAKNIPNPVIDEYNRLAAAATGKPVPESLAHRPTLTTSSEEENTWEEVASRQNLVEGQYVVFNSGGAFGAAKHWPLSSFVNLAKKIVTSQEMPVVMICGPAEQDLARQFEKEANHPLITSIADEEISIGLSKCMVRHAGWMVTTDSGPRHFAHAFEVPALSIYGPTHIAWSDTHYELARACQLPVDCGPCQQRTCPLKHHRCMQDLTADKVYQEFLALQASVMQHLNHQRDVA